MIQPLSAVASLLQGLRQSSERMTRAAGVAARFGLEPAPEAATPGAAAKPAALASPRESDDLPGAMVDMLIAQRAFSAQLRALQTAERMADEAANLGRDRT